MSGIHPFGGHLSKRFGRLAPEDAYLSYYDVRLTKEDINVLKNDWLTDNVISFWEEYLEREYLTNYNNSKIVLLRPSMVLIMGQMSVSDLRGPNSPLPNFSMVTHIFLPINDCENYEVAEGGTHWSLLLVSVMDGVSFHYDSFRPSNSSYAYNFSNKLSQILNIRLRFIELRDTPQQDNGMDCGVFVCIFMRHLLLKRLLMVRTNEKVSMSMGGRQIDAREGRREILRLIEDRRKEGERRRSTSKSPDPRKSDPPRIDSPMRESRPRTAS